MFFARSYDLLSWSPPAFWHNNSIASVICHPSHGLSFFGKTPGLCENNDKFAVDRSLNADPRPGDVAVIHDSGAHGHSMGFNYNGKPRSAEPLDHL